MSSFCLAVMNERRYSELIKLQTFEDRFNYLRLHGEVGKETFGFDRIYNQKFYRSKEWKDIRNYVITRDLGCDLGIFDREILGRIMVHHMNPISMEDIKHSSDYLLNPDYLITVSPITHDAIHYSDESILLSSTIVERKLGDTKLW